MRALADHYRATRARWPDEPLMIVFDIDGTILDMREMVLEVLLGYDRHHGTRFFYGLRVEDVTVHENQVETLLAGLGLPEADRAAIHEWYLHNRWSSEAIVASHRPYRGVLDIIRWFQLQPHTAVGLNTGRPEIIRADTLRCLNALGREYRVRFEPDQLYMNPGAWEEKVADAKLDGLRHFERQGYRLFAMVDNEPANIVAMAAGSRDGSILFLHADTLFESQRRELAGTVSGSRYELARLAAGDDVPQRVQLVWHAVNDRARLERFFGSPVRWGECDVRRDPIGRLVLRDVCFRSAPWSPDEQLLTLREGLAAFRENRRRVKMDLKQPGDVIDEVVDLLDEAGFAAEQAWFSANLEALGREGFRHLAARCPGAVIQCPVDFLRPLLAAAPDEARRVLDLLRSWGVTRFSLGWSEDCRPHVLRLVEEWGEEVNLYAVPDLESFLQAALMLPCSLTSDFGAIGLNAER